MSRAFVKENDGDAPEDFPERPVSSHPNFVTARGLAQIESRVRALTEAREAARLTEERAALSRIDRDLRYWLQRKGGAKLVTPDAQPAVVRFGVRASVRYEDAEIRDFTLVGEDEATPAEGLISWVSPIGQALIGAQVGDEVTLNGRRAEIVRLETPGGRGSACLAAD